MPTEKTAKKTVAKKKRPAARRRGREEAVKQATDVVVDLYGAAIKELANR